MDRRIGFALLLAAAPAGASEDCAGRWSSEYRISREAWNDACALGKSADEIVAGARLSNDAGGGAIGIGTGAGTATGVGASGGGGGVTKTRRNDASVQQGGGGGAVAPPPAVDCSVDVTVPGWDPEAVRRQERAHDVPPFMRCLIKKLRYGRTYEKLAQMPGGPGDRGARFTKEHQRLSVGFLPFVGPACRLSAAAPDYVPDDKCFSVIWVSEKRGGNPLCYNIGGGTEDHVNGLVIQPPPYQFTRTHRDICAGLKTGKRYYCNYTMIGGGKPRPAPGKDCDVALIAPTAQGPDPD